MNDIYKIFETKEFKSLPLYKKFWVRLKIAFFESLTMF